MADKFDYRIFYRRNLPHYQPSNGQFFITYRLAFSLPTRILEALKKKAEEFERKSINYSGPQRKHLQQQYSKILFAMEDDFLSKYEHSPKWLEIEAVAKMVIESLLFNHTRKYDLICALLMSNHVHIVFKPLHDSREIPYSFPVIMRDHKSYTAHEANTLLGRTGAFWFHENYDHYIRDENELHRIIQYILNNPVKAGLAPHYTEWKHYWVNPDYIHI